jgi:hypothetical protein
MTPLYQDPHFTFHFAEDRIVPRFHRASRPGDLFPSSRSTPAAASAWACWRRRPWARRLGEPPGADYRAGRRGIRCGAGTA